MTFRLLRGLIRQAPPPLEDPLTVRELEIARLVARGHTNADIAVQLTISPGTVRTHIQQGESR
ncbi:helix-turn-helix transcriptional regulator [Nonomuraea purpurea]|uniref:Helix-turn-helix transcriptional regulator n=1 Tax=Nonomuraea purpurea TaxID=1849276 RepID=A0ABV8GBN1_9ACTN